MESIIFSNELLALYKAGKRAVIIEASSGEKAKYDFRQEHLQGAKFVDLEHDLSSVQDPKYGGRHPLVSIQEFSKLLGGLGINPTSHVVVYDRAHGTNAAARFWWMLRSVGHKSVQVLSSGFEQAKAFGIPTESGESTLSGIEPYPINGWQLPMSSMNEVAESINDANSVIIDVREQKRFRGETEPIDLIAGHIPGAINIPLANNLTDQGIFKSPEELRTIYGPYFQDKDFEKIIVHCGSGVTACHTILAIDYAGLPMPKLYVGSWSEWSRNDNPMETI